MGTESGATGAAGVCNRACSPLTGFRQAFGLMRIIASQKPTGPRGAPGPRGAQGLPWTNADEIATAIDKQVCAEFSAFASGINDAFCESVFALGTEIDPLVGYYQAAAQPWGKWLRKVACPPPDGLADAVVQGKELVLVARQTRPVTTTVSVARTIYSAGDTIYLVISVESPSDNTLLWFVSRKETLPLRESSPVSSLSIGRYLLDSTFKVKQLDTTPPPTTSPACMLISSLGTLSTNPAILKALKNGGSYVYPHAGKFKNLTRIEALFKDPSYVSQIDGLHIMHIGILRCTTEAPRVTTTDYVLVVPYLLEKGKTDFSYHEGPYFCTGSGMHKHTGAAVVVMSSGVVTSIESPAGATIVVVGGKK